MRNPSRPLAAALVVICTAALGAGERTRDALLARLPKYDPAQSAAAREAAANKVAPPAPEEGVVVLPEFKVIEKKVAEPEPDQWMTNEAITAREVRRAEAEMSALELALNRWHIPLLMPSFAQRARANYEATKFREKIGNFHELARTLEKTDPKGAKKIRDSLDFRKLPKDDD